MKKGNAKLCARDLMVKKPVVVDTATPVIEAARRMIDGKVSNAPVVEVEPHQDVLAGFISEKDILEAYTTGRLHAVPELKVGEIMRVYPASVRPDTDLFTLAAMFMQHEYRHLPVTSGQVLQGIVNRRDVLAKLLTKFGEWQRQDPATRKVPDLARIFTPRSLLG